MNYDNIIKNYINTLDIPQPEAQLGYSPYADLYGKAGDYVAVSQAVAPVLTGALGMILGRGAGLPGAVGLSSGVKAGLKYSGQIQEDINARIRQLLQEQQIEKALQAKAMEEQRRLQEAMTKLALQAKALEQKGELERRKLELEREALEAKKQYYKTIAGTQSKKVSTAASTQLGKEARYWLNLYRQAADALNRVNKGEDIKTIMQMNPALADVLKNTLGKSPADNTEGIEALNTALNVAWENYKRLAGQSGLTVPETQPNTPTIPSTIDDLLKLTGE